MNTGAVLLEKEFIDVTSLVDDFRRFHKDEWEPTWKDGPYADDKWRVVKVIEEQKHTAFFGRFTLLEEVVSRFKCTIRHAMFYSLLPGGELHPHRDMSGAVGLGGVRFHIPIITNPRVDFLVSGERFVMLPGELWALDTSFLHAVSNRGGDERVHLVLEVEVNDWVRSILPPLDLRYYLHQANVARIGVQKVVHVVLFDREKLAGNLNVARNVLRKLRSKLFSAGAKP